MYYHVFLYYHDPFLKILFIFRERGRDGKRDGEKHQNTKGVLAVLFEEENSSNSFFPFFFILYLLANWFIFSRIYASVFLNFLTNKRHLFWFVLFFLCEYPTSPPHHLLIYVYYCDHDLNLMDALIIYHADVIALYLQFLLPTIWS